MEFLNNHGEINMQHNDKDEPCTVINVYCEKGEHHHKDHCDCPFGKNAEFAELYSSLPQLLAASPGPNLAGQSALFENVVYSTAGIDVSQANVNGQIKINKAGWYDISSGMSGSLNPIPSPLPVWTMSLFQNGNIVPGSTFANLTLSPVQQANEVVADVFLHFNVGDVVQLANTSVSQVNLTAPTLGTNAQTNSCYLKIQLLKAD
jgi:hypothetical protein